ncbi:D-tyrosyl-tRNA(Tyr) deacylase [Seinonella peptonophila]|uniref:D-aminoacyl-tRNA deacylase n=1 Tax=Seinonella peptonophila TaxID=112248 RepID=A0A1M4WBE6_9BACL|nr:D-aminoacyl-tRNA deacylase [Seinonella peptonophila]SHE78554.1 D-tyrosyl-tRNA(Tyr) deacylase [Seinonella peptonophila]
MRVLLQRAKQAKVTVEEQVTGAIDSGFVLLVGIKHGDTQQDADEIARKLVNLRIFEDEQGKMNRSLLEVGGAILSVSQFTLYGDTRKGRRPNFMAAASPDQAKSLYNYLNDRLRSYDVRVETGIFGAMMEVCLTNDGPVTMMLETENGVLI